MILTSPIFVVAFAGLLHASFQLGVSLLTLLSGHSLGTGRSFRKLMWLNVSYLIGASVTTILFFAGLAYFTLLVLHVSIQSLWIILAILNIVIGLAVMIFYYRHGKGTGLWIPRAMADYLVERTRKTKRPGEAFTLGAGSVLAEIPFLIGPVSIAVLYSLTTTSALVQFINLFLYALISLSPLLIIVGLVGAGHKISTIQKWREDNKLFLQYCAGSGLVVLGIFVFVDKVIGGIV